MTPPDPGESLCSWLLIWIVRLPYYLVVSKLQKIEVNSSAPRTVCAKNNSEGRQIMSGKLRKAGQHVQLGMEKIRGKKWAEPLGKGLAISAKIVSRMGNFVPGTKILGGALSFGASLLNPEQRIENSEGEIRENFVAIKKEMNELFKSVEQDNNNISENLSQMKDVISRTYILVADVRYRVSLFTLPSLAQAPAPAGLSEP